MRQKHLTDPQRAVNSLMMRTKTTFVEDYGPEMPDWGLELYDQLESAYCKVHKTAYLLGLRRGRRLERESY